MKAIPALLFSILLLSCSTTKEKIPPVENMNDSRGKTIIYQLLPRLFGNKVTTNKQFGTKEENGVGKFNDITDVALKAIKEMGISHVWYTGILEHATVSDYSPYGIPPDDADIVKGMAGSPYAIKDYYDVAPDLATDVSKRMNEFERLIERSHTNGLKVIIDFVPNHVARTYHSDAKPATVKDLGQTDDKSVSFSPKNNFYYLPGKTFKVPINLKALGSSALLLRDKRFEETPAKVTGNDKFTEEPSINDWFETVKLNYGVDIPNGNTKHFDPIPDTWEKMRDILLFWTNKNIDGFRCDMAEMVPVEFWNWVIPQVKQVNPGALFIGEIYEPLQYRNYLKQGKFDYLYDKVMLYDTLRMLVEGKRNTLDITTIQQNLSDVSSSLLHFMENHDEQRLASKFVAGDIWKATPAMVVSATIDQGAVMLYSGQEVGEAGSGAEGFSTEDGRTTIFDYWGMSEHQKWMNGGAFNGGQLSMEQKQLKIFYSDVLNLAGTNAAIANGAYYDLTASNIASGNFDDKITAFIRTNGNEILLIVCGFNNIEKIIHVQIPKETREKIGIDEGSAYIAHDVLWKEVEVGFDKDWKFELKMRPFSSFIFKIK